MGKSQQRKGSRAGAPAEKRITIFSVQHTYALGGAIPLYTRIVTRIPGRHFLRNLVERRALVAQLVRRDFEMRYVGSAAGWAWGVVHPIVQLGVWYFIFQVCLKMSLPPDSVTTNYPMFLFCGFLPWMLFQET